ncbi:transmembrane protein 50B-like [Saccoglossus kowalevskii]
MSGWLDNVRCPSCTCECGCLAVVAEKRNMISSAAAGTLFFVGWWLYIDAMVACDSDDYHLAFMTCGIVGSLAFAM